MNPMTCVLALLAGCGGPSEVPPAEAPEEAQAPAEAAGPPEGFSCPEGAAPVGGDKAVAAAHWYRPTLPQLTGDGPWNSPEQGLEAEPIVGEMGDGDSVWICLGEGEVPNGAYLATIADGGGVIEGQFAGGEPDGAWTGLWTVDEPTEPEEPAGDGEATEGGEADDDAPGAEGGEAGDDAPAAEAEEPAPDAPTQTKPKGAVPITGAPEVPPGKQFMFEGTYAGGVQVGLWLWGCEPGCDRELRVIARFDDEGSNQGAWTWFGDGEMVKAVYVKGVLSGRYVHAVGERVTRGQFVGGTKMGKWTVREGDEVVEEADHGGRVGSPRSPGRRKARP